MIWLITGENCKDFIVDAESFDEALSIARSVNKNYTTGQVVG